MSGVLIDTGLVNSLLRTQLPHELRYLLDAPLVPMGRGWHHALFRLGAHHAARIPLSAHTAEITTLDGQWLAASTPLAGIGVDIPRPIFRGHPGPILPWSWSIVPWIRGIDMTEVPTVQRAPYAPHLAEALALLHTGGQQETPSTPARTVELHDRRSAMRSRFPAVSAELDAEATRTLHRLWLESLEPPHRPGPGAWVHGDLLPTNVIVNGRRVAGLINFHTLDRADPAMDLSCAWTMFDDAGRALFREAVEDLGSYDPHVWRRAKGWAVVQITALMNDPVSRRNHSDIILHTLQALA